MRSCFPRSRTILAALLGGSLLYMTVSGLAQPQHKPNSKQRESLKTFLRSYVGAPSGDDKETRYSFAFVDLNDDGKPEVIVHIYGGSWCGSGGCTTLILAPKGSSFEIVTHLTITRLPIRVLDSKTNGWHDLIVEVRGGGIEPAYDSLLSFDGKSYPSNPSTPPAKQLAQKVPGRVVLPAMARGELLY